MCRVVNSFALHLNRRWVRNPTRKGCNAFNVGRQHTQPRALHKMGFHGCKRMGCVPGIVFDDRGLFRVWCSSGARSRCSSELSQQMLNAQLVVSLNKGTPI